jgi:uncharacterized protein (DUF2062 family)
MVFSRQFRYYFIRLKRLRGTPQALAGGVAIGVLIGLTPTIPLHTVLILILAYLTRTSAIAAIIVSWIVCNPLSVVPLYTLCAYIGNHITPFHLSTEKLQILLNIPHSLGEWRLALHKIMELGYETIVVMLSGSLLIALPTALIAYFTFLPIFTRRMEKKQDKKSY